MRELNIQYETWKNVIQNNSEYSLYHVIEGYNTVSAFCGAVSFIFCTRIDIDGYNDWVENFIENSTKLLSKDDAIAYILNFESPMQQTRIYTRESLDGVPIISTKKPIIEKKNYFSHNFCDKTTWYGDAVRVVDEVAENTGNNITYQLDHYNIIDTFHGKLLGEDNLTDSNGNSYRVEVRINDVDGYLEQDPHYNTGGDYLIDYSNAQIIFQYELLPTDIVKVTYHYENGSTYYIKPPNGKSIVIFNAEVQFSKNVLMKDTIHHQVYIYNPYNPYGPKIEYTGLVSYKSVSDLLIESNKSYPIFPAISQGNWRGLSDEIIIMSWDYLGGEILPSSYGTELRIWLEHHEEFEGEYCSITFYTTLQDE